MNRVVRFLSLSVLAHTTRRRLVLVAVAILVALIAFGGEALAFPVLYPCEPTWWTVLFGCW